MIFNPLDNYTKIYKVSGLLENYKLKELDHTNLLLIEEIINNRLKALLSGKATVYNSEPNNLLKSRSSVVYENLSKIIKKLSKINPEKIVYLEDI